MIGTFEQLLIDEITRMADIIALYIAQHPTDTETIARLKAACSATYEAYRQLPEER